MMTCTSGSPTTPSVCSCQPGYTMNASICISSCGDGLLISPETCDDGDKGGCLKGCIGVSENYECSGGSNVAPSLCKCIKGF
jgi:hypothetical protein